MPVRDELDLGWSLTALLVTYLERGNEVFAEVPGGPRGYQVLRSVERGDPVSQLDLARRVGLDRTVITYLLDDLETEGLVRRRVDPTDRRVRRVEPTTKGRRLLPKLDQRLATLERELLSDLSDSEAATLRDLLRRAASAQANSEAASDPLHLIRQLRADPVRRSQRTESSQTG